MKKLVLIAVMGLTVAGCSRTIGDDRLRFEGELFSAGVKSERGDRASFTATARPASVSLVGSAQAAAHEATRHCLRYYGTSEILWTTGPDSIESDPVIDGDSLVLTGTCRDLQG